MDCRNNRKDSFENIIRKNHRKIKGGIITKENSHRTLSRPQTVLAEKAAAYLSDHINGQITVSGLSERFHVSPTYLQNAFKGVYGVPVWSYSRMLKMQFAALRLIHTDLTVLAIANECGYDNASKFASAFRKVMGEPPAEYRRSHGSLEETDTYCVVSEPFCVGSEWKRDEKQNTIKKDL